MNKAELTAEVAERLSGGDADARQYVDAVFDVIMGRVAAGERVQILGFGTFDSVERAPRVGRNPRTGEAIQVPAGVLPRFHAGQKFRAQVTDGLAVAPVSAAAAEAEAEVEESIAQPAKAKKIKAVPEKAGADKKAFSDKKAASEKKAGADKKAAKPAKPADKKTAKPAKPADKKAAKPAKPADKKAAKPAKPADPAGKKAPKTVKIAKKSAKTAKTAKAAKAGKK